MTKYIPKADPKTSAERYWYAQGFSQGIQARTKEIAANKARADTKWAEVQTIRARLHGIRAIAQALERLTDGAGID